MLKKRHWIAALAVVLGFSLSCQLFSPVPGQPETFDPTATKAPTSAPLPLITAPPGEHNPQDPVFISGEIPYTSPFFLNTISQPFVLLEDQTGFVNRDRLYEFPLLAQVIGPVTVAEDGSVSYSLSLPTVPQGNLLDLDNDAETDTGVQVYALSYWSNTWGDPFMEERDGTGWSTAYTSMVTDPERDDEISGGKLIVWAPDDQQAFPTGFGEDNLLFTPDDPSAPIPSGYTIVDLDQDPFLFYKEPNPVIPLLEGDVAVNDYASMDYEQAFDALFEKVSKEYPFTPEKGIDWEALYEEISPQVADAGSTDEFYRALRAFTFSIPDAHINLSLDPSIFIEERGGGFGLVLTELSDGSVIAAQVLPGTPAEEAGIQPGAKIISWDGQPVSEAISEVVPDFGPYSTDHHRRIEQAIFLTRVSPGERRSVEFQNPGASSASTEELESILEYDSLFTAIPSFNQDPIRSPIEGMLLEDSGLGYLKVGTFSDDYNLLASSWENYIQRLSENEVPGLIIDLRNNSGGAMDLALSFAGYFFDEEIPLYDGYYYSDESGKFESDESPAIVNPAPFQFDGPVAVLVSPYCVSACEGFAYALTLDERSIIVGSFPTAGAFGEVGRGQYNMPDELSMQFPTGRPLSPEGDLLIEGVGVVPDITVPVTAESALGESDPVLQAAIDALMERIQQ